MNGSDEEILNEFRRRRQVFDQLCSRLWDRYRPPYEVFNRYTCPVCAYPTLNRRSFYDMCTLCEWEDDGQDDDEADEVWGGPNGDYSLTESRLNFARYGCMYRPGEMDFERLKTSSRNSSSRNERPHVNTSIVRVTTCGASVTCSRSSKKTPCQRSS